jgi:uncharacterized protein YlxP (DUF503 family)
MKNTTQKTARKEEKAILLINKMSEFDKQQVAQSYIDADSFCQSLLKNKQDSANLKNKELVKIASRTYANSILRKNDKLTETAVIDIALVAFTVNNEQCTLQQVSEFIESEFTMRITATRIRKHIRDNKQKVAHFFKNNVNVLENDVLSFSENFVAMSVIEEERKLMSN